MKRRTAILAVIGLAVLLAFSVFRLQNESLVAAQDSAAKVPSARVVNPAAGPGMNIDPTAVIHPSVILDGKITIGAFSVIGPGTILEGNIRIGHHTRVACNVTIRGPNKIGNFTQIYDNVNIEGGRGANVGTSGATGDQSIIGDGCWINHGAVMHGTQVGDGGAVGLGAACDYNTHIGKGAILANGSATRVNQVIPDNCFAEGVPAVIKKRNITDQDRLAYLGLLPAARTRFFGEAQEAAARKRMAAR